MVARLRKIGRGLSSPFWGEGWGEGKHRRIHIRMNFRNLAKECAGLALAKKAKEILVLDVRKLTSITDYFVICSGGSNIHVEAIAEWIISKLKGRKIPPLHIEGEKQAQWVLIDYVGVIVHVFYEPTRKFYALEKLWGDGRKVRFQEGKRKKPKSSDRLKNFEE